MAEIIFAGYEAQDVWVEIVIGSILDMNLLPDTGIDLDL